MATRDEWPYPVTWCPTCRRGFRAVEDLVDHQLTKRHWRPLPPPDPPEALCARLVAKAPAVNPAGAAQLKDAVMAAEARRQEEGIDADPLSL
jgi:protein-disulfide isomerase